MDCIFCAIAEKKIPATIVFEDDKYLAFKDINPEAPVHILVIPKKHIVSISQLQKEDQELIGGLFMVIKSIAQEEGIAETGYRVVANTGTDGGQTVNHIHFHLLGKRALQWPPG